MVTIQKHGGILRKRKVQMDTKTPENKKNSPRLKVLIIILSVLLVLSAGGLAAKYVYDNFFASDRASVTVPDNVIGDDGDSAQSGESSGTDGTQSGGTGGESVPAGSGDVSGSESTGTGGSETEDRPAAKLLELYKTKPEDNEKFEVKNMLPGDTVTGYFCVRVNHGEALDLYFSADVTGQTKQLGDVLEIKVTRVGEDTALCDLPFSEADGREYKTSVAENGGGVTDVYYRIDVSLDTSVGNEYQAAGLTADFKWFVKDESGLVSPGTGDTSITVLWALLAASSAALIILLPVYRKGDKKREKA